jgi:hypothetical protein
MGLGFFYVKRKKDLILNLFIYICKILWRAMSFLGSCRAGLFINGRHTTKQAKSSIRMTYVFISCLFVLTLFYFFFYSGKGIIIKEQINRDLTKPPNTFVSTVVTKGWEKVISKPGDLITFPKKGKIIK